MSDDISQINLTPKTLEEATSTIQKLVTIIIELKAEIADLKEKLRTNSQNSSLPPSKDLRKQKI